MAERRASVHMHSTGFHEGRRSSIVPAPPIDSSINVQDDDVFRRMSVALPNFEDVTADAKEMTETERAMSVWEAVTLWPKAVIFSMIMSMALIMEGYDTALLGNFFALRQFNEKFGHEIGNSGKYTVSSTWQSGLANGAQVGQICGLMVAGLIADRWGYKPTILVCLAAMIGLIFLFFFAKSIEMIFVAEILCGFPWGAFQTLTTTYAADVTPIKLRPILTTWVNCCWVIGQLISSGVLRGLLVRSDQWAWRIPYAIQWAFPLPIFIGVLFAPESPTWLVKTGQMDKARASLRKLASKKVTDEAMDQKLTMLHHTNELERTIGEGTSYADCFRGTNLRRTEIACIVWIAQVWCGIWFGGNVVYFLSQTGFSQDKAFDFGIGTGGLALVGTLSSWVIMQYVGRRRLYLVGLTGMAAILLIVGFMGIPPESDAISYASGSLFMLFVLIFDLTIGPVCYCLVAEIPSTRMRIKTVVLARNCYNVASLVANFLNPPILNPTAWNLRGKGGFVWVGFCIIVLVWSFFRLPEPKGLSPAELDILFENKVGSRHFKTAQIDAFRSDSIMISTEHMDVAQIAHNEKGFSK